MISEKDIYEFCLRRNLPYFGAHLVACPGIRARHLGMDMLVESLAKTGHARPIRILEVGSWAGASTNTFARSLKKHNDGLGAVVAVDPWEPYHTPDQLAQGGPGLSDMDQALKEDRIFALFRHNLKALNNDDIVMTIRGRSETVLPALDRESFQLVFIDGDHAFRSVSRDIANAMPLVAPGGFLSGGDLELQLHEVDSGFAVATSHLDFVTDPRTGLHYHPGVTRAVGEVFGHVAVNDGFWYVRKAMDGWERSSLAIGTPDVIPAHLEHLLPSVLPLIDELLSYVQSSNDVASLSRRGT